MRLSAFARAPRQSYELFDWLCVERSVQTVILHLKTPCLVILEPKDIHSSRIIRKLSRAFDDAQER